MVVLAVMVDKAHHLMHRTFAIACISTIKKKRAQAALENSDLVVLAVMGDKAHHLMHRTFAIACVSAKAKKPCANFEK
ncbi:MAG: hypothetical protein RSD19_00065 [Oscillospiraceae bacterium]